ncbi:MAG: helix-turn-helix transcriptional regulator [Actinobacteria bacterium]|nr:helix-turn-helix transcriptional regulator [Actinomycetota bacterium]
MLTQTPVCCPVLESPLTDEEAESTARVFRALADPARVKLLSLVAANPDGEMCVCGLTEPLGLSQPTVSHHLKVLVDAGLLHREKRGTWAWFRVNHDAIAAASAALR